MSSAWKALSVHELVELQAEKTPDAVAIVFQTQQLTYQQLNQKANQLAHYLQASGVKPETLVGICVERSLEMIISLLGVLKAGGAYVPLDPSYPTERLAFMLGDAQLPVLITQQHLLSMLPHTDQVKVVCLDSAWPAIDPFSQDNVDSGVSPENLAYTIYTSGSTGNPKGVQILHAAVVNFLYSMQQEPGLAASDVLLAVTTISFDIAVLELFLPLTVGARIVIVSREVASDAKQLSQTITDSGATVMQATPATWRMLLTMGWQGHQPLKILCGGEALTRSLANQLLDKGRSLWNLYGPTETTIWSAVHRVERGHDSVSIGHAIAHTQIYLLNELARRQEDLLEPVPSGQPGEIYIGGTGVARGYLNRPELTNERFVPNPFSDQPGDRLYKTGDLARYRPDGTIEFIGRTDHQVKIRGFRIELGAIESVISHHPDVGDVAVVAKEDASGHRRLVAYFSPRTAAQEGQLSVANWKPAIEQIAQWQHIWNAIYDPAVTSADPTVNFSGWKDSYTGLPTPKNEMEEWLNYTVQSILSLQPKRVLEIGCGMGLLLFRIAPHCTHYVGTDLSHAALDYIQTQMQNCDQDWHQIVLKRGAAHELSGLADGSFDTVIINSVIQYFPHAAYLVQVLDKAVQLVKPGGHIFVGDVRSLPLLEAFHTSVELSQAPESLSIPQLQHQIRKRLAHEKELVLHPNFFVALQRSIPQITEIKTSLKRGRYQNEVTRFRYDVTLTVGAEAQSVTEERCFDWQQHQLTWADVRQLLSEPPSGALKITGIPNARTLPTMRAITLLADPNVPKTVGALRAVLEQTTNFKGICPEAVWNLTENCPNSSMTLTWSEQAVESCFDVSYRKQPQLTELATKIVAIEPTKPDGALNWDAYTNQGSQSAQSGQLVPNLRQYLKAKLPEYMVPSLFISMDTLPLTPNGKIDRRALPDPKTSRPELQETFVAPHTSMEKQLAEIWAQLLGIDKVGIYDNFFELGGHSLLTVQLLAQIQAVMKVELPLFYIFKDPTIAGLIRAIDGIDQLGHTTPDTTPTINLQTEAVLDAKIYAKVPFIASTTELEQVFLTGATGFLGAFLLHELLHQTEAKIHCLVRADSLAEGKSRIQANLERYLLWHEELSSRIMPVLGDLSLPCFGLSTQQFTQLAGIINQIYHNGALINLVYPYTALRDCNVFGTQEVLRLASLIKPVPVHFISTLDVFQSSAYFNAKVILESDRLESTEGLYRGYAQTKWVAEKLLLEAQSRGIPVSVYRPAMISGHSQTGISQSNDLFCRVFKGMMQMGVAPDLDRMMHIVPVDYVSKAIIHLSLQPESLGQAFHLINPRPMHFSTMMQAIYRLGYPMRLVPYGVWLAHLRNLDEAQDNALQPLVSLLTEQADDQITYLELSLLSPQIFDCNNTLRGLRGTTIVCPPVNADLLKAYWTALVSLVRSLPAATAFPNRQR